MPTSGGVVQCRAPPWTAVVMFDTISYFVAIPGASSSIQENAYYVDMSRQSREHERGWVFYSPMGRIYGRIGRQESLNYSFVSVLGAPM